MAGPLIYHFDAFKIVQQMPELLQVTAVSLPPLPTPPATAAGQFTIATFNLENHFDTLDDTGNDAEPKPAPADIAIKQTKLAYALANTLDCPTLVGIQEVEKASLLLDLATAVSETCGFTYDITYRQSADVRGIDVALFSNPQRVTILDARLHQECNPINTGIDDDSIDCPAGEHPLFSRPPLVVGLEIEGQRYTIIVNHFKSKRGGEAETAPRRLAQAQHINRVGQCPAGARRDGAHCGYGRF